MKSYLSVPLIAVVAVAFTWPTLGQQTQNPSPKPGSKLMAPTKGTIPVAFILTEGAVMIDFAGPWEVFQDVHIESRGATMEEQMPFDLYTVSDSRKPIRVSGGMQVVPDYTFEDAPQPRVVVVPAQSGKSPKMMEWIRKMSTQSDVLMSVCTGAFRLGEAGVLQGKKATTHHASYGRFERAFPDVFLQRGKRYVQADSVVFTAGGLSSGIDLALHVVELYYGRTAAEQTARHMEYEGKGWMGDGTASVSYAAPAAGPSPCDTLSSGVLGNWQGTLDAMEGPLRLVVHIWRDKDGKLTGTVDSPDEDFTGLAISVITQKESDLHFEVGSITNIFDGKINTKESAITGTWKLGHGSLPLVLKRVVK